MMEDNEALNRECQSVKMFLFLGELSSRVEDFTYNFLLFIAAKGQNAL